MTGKLQGDMLKAGKGDKKGEYLTTLQLNSRYDAKGKPRKGV